MTDMIMRQEVWNSALTELQGSIPNAHDLATRIADRFAAERRNRFTSRHVSEAKREAIKYDLTVGYWTYREIRERHSVGMSTVQRITQELRQQGVTVHTVGSRNSGRRFPRHNGRGH